VSTPPNNDDDKRWFDIAMLIEAISSGITYYYMTITDVENAPDKDAVLSAMQMLSLMCARSWGYTEEQINALWNGSIRDYKSLSSDDIPATRVNVYSSKYKN
jgi:hypothetical protein